MLFFFLWNSRVKSGGGVFRKLMVGMDLKFVCVFGDKRVRRVKGRLGLMIYRIRRCVVVIIIVV